MGNSTSSSGRGHHEETVDFGHLTPQGIYTGPRDWNQGIVSQLICQRRLAPFYRPLEEYEDSWDDDQILAARKELPAPDADSGETLTRTEATTSSSISTKSSHTKRQASLKEPSKPEAAIYRGAVECPICFLYYPTNINHSRCCDQAICTECFVQIKRSEPTTTHLVSEPAACPYCVQENFGVVYKPPPWRAGIGCEMSSWPDPSKSSPHPIDPPVSYPTHKRRQKSYGADSPEVVTTDAIRPDWEAKLAAVRAAVARRANRRIIMRQVGDRLIPVGITSGRVHTLSPEEAQAEGIDNGGSRRSRRRAQNPNFEQFMGMAGQDLEELMLMEAMRLSMIDHEEHQRKEAEGKKKQAAAIAQSEAESASTPGSSALEPSSGSPTSLSPGSRSVSPGPLLIPQGQPQESLTVPSGPLPSISRSQTPPLHSTRSSPREDAMSSTWHRRTPSPAPFGTLTAASAILGSGISPGNPAVTNGEVNSGTTNSSHTSSMPNDQSKSSHRPGSPLPYEQLPADVSPQSTVPLA